MIPSYTPHDNLFSRKHFIFEQPTHFPKDPSDSIEKRNDDDDSINSKNPDFMDIHHESASQYDPETSSLISEHATFDERRSILYSRKLLPLLSFLLFLITNVIPIVISCGFYSRVHCFKLGTLEVSPLLQWIYIVITSMISPDDIPMN